MTSTRPTPADYVYPIGTRVRLIPLNTVQAGLVNAPHGQSALNYEIDSNDVGTVAQIIVLANTPTKNFPDVTPTIENVGYRIRVNRPTGRTQLQRGNPPMINSIHHIFLTSEVGTSKPSSDFLPKLSFAFLLQDVKILQQGEKLLTKGTAIVIMSEAHSKTGKEKAVGLKPEKAYYKYSLAKLLDPGITIGNPAGIAIPHAHLALADQ
ncbi:hypothetical protein H0H92_008672 [Tricholoma furcatifolium]|nr:hypothetical protein H0H92_008672 [Tricholoma furcatifolium]